jgi:hypothetical protein
MKKVFTHEQEIELIKYIVRQYKTKSVAQIHAEMIITHPHLDLTKSQIGNIIKRLKKCYDTRSAEYRINNRLLEAAEIERRKHITLPDKRCKRQEAAQEVVDQDIIQTIADADLLHLNNCIQLNQEDISDVK